MAQVNPVLGYQCTLTIDGVSGRFKSASGNPANYSKVDCSTIKDGGCRVYTKGLLDKIINGVLELSDDTAATSIIDIAKARTAVQCAFSVGGITVSGLMHVFVTNIDGGLDDTVALTIECSPAPETTTTTTTTTETTTEGN